MNDQPAVVARVGQERLADPDKITAARGGWGWGPGPFVAGALLGGALAAGAVGPYYYGGYGYGPYYPAYGAYGPYGPYGYGCRQAWNGYYWVRACY
jgi:hypothetical protein